jgi:hypothetical protein
LLAAVLFMGADLHGLEMHGVKVPKERAVGDRTLVLNGAGLRTATLLNIKVYVAALYLPEASSDPRTVMDARPVWMDFTFVREVDEKRGDEAWRFQFKESVPDPYPGLERDVRTLTDLFGPIRKFGVQSFHLDGDETKVYENGEYKGRVQGAEFQKAFMSIWMGPKPPTEALKNALLGEVRR